MRGPELGTVSELRIRTRCKGNKKQPDFVYVYILIFAKWPRNDWADIFIFSLPPLQPPITPIVEVTCS